MAANFTTVPLRCPACGQQTHKTLQAIVSEGALVCRCGARSEVDVGQFADEIRKSQDGIKDFGRQG